MKKLKYVFLFVLGLFLASCEEQVIEPHTDDDPIVVPPPCTKC